MATHIIGGGFSGLYLAHTLKKAAPNEEVHLHEASGRIGGKCTGSDPHGERGPWRIHDSHLQVLALVEELGLTTVKNLPYSQTAEASISRAKSLDAEARAAVGARPGHLSVRDEHYWSRTRSAPAGYPGLEHQASAPGVAKPTYTADAGEYRHVVGGMGALVEALEQRLHKQGVKIRTGAYLTQITADRRLVFRVDNTTTEKVPYRRAYLCVPAHHLRELQLPGRNPLRPLLAAVEPYSLNHCYYRSERRLHRQRVTQEGQWVPAQQPGQWDQVYTGGENARTWNRARYRHPGRILQACGATEFRMHYWPCATYTWRPSPVFTQETTELDQKCMFPLAASLGVIVLSESLSRNQGWLEGACSNVSGCRRYLEEPVARAAGSEEAIRVGAYRIPWAHLESAWGELHPGGAGALRNYRREERWDRVLERIPHSDEAWAHVFHLAAPPTWSNLGKKPPTQKKKKE